MPAKTNVHAKKHIKVLKLPPVEEYIKMHNDFIKDMQESASTNSNNISTKINELYIRVLRMNVLTGIQSIRHSEEITKLHKEVQLLKQKVKKNNKKVK